MEEGVLPCSDIREEWRMTYTSSLASDLVNGQTKAI